MRTPSDPQLFLKWLSGISDTATFSRLLSSKTGEVRALALRNAARELFSDEVLMIHALAEGCRADLLSNPSLSQEDFESIAKKAIEVLCYPAEAAESIALLRNLVNFKGVSNHFVATKVKHQLRSFDRSPSPDEGVHVSANSERATIYVELPCWYEYEASDLEILTAMSGSSESLLKLLIQHPASTPKTIVSALELAPAKYSLFEPLYTWLAEHPAERAPAMESVVRELLHSSPYDTMKFLECCEPSWVALLPEPLRVKLLQSSDRRLRMTASQFA